MKERRYVKFKLDIYDDTKTKIIDQRPERDFIHYFFARSIILAGKSDCEGELFMAKDIPYTIETLAIEFGRDKALVKLALDVLMDLKMIEITEDNIYRVKSFAKHQNIKAKEEVKVKSKEAVNPGENNKEINGKLINTMTTSNKEAEIKRNNQIEDSSKDKILEELDNRINQGKSIGLTFEHENNEINCNNIKNADIAVASSEANESKNYLCNDHNQQNIESDSEKSNLINLEMKENKKAKKKKNESNLITELAADEIEDGPPLFFFSDGDMPPLEEGERLVWGTAT